MKYVITGSLGHISKPLVNALTKAGNQVVVISSSAARAKEIAAAGASAAIGSVEDTDFLNKTFAGATAVYTMVPPNFGAADWKAYIGQVGKNYADAIAANKIKYVVNLSSVGAHLPDGVGPVSGLYRVEQALNALKDVNVLHLRPAYFYQNLLANIGMIKHAGIIGGNYSVAENKFVIVDPRDIAAVAAAALLKLNFTGHSVQYIASDETSTDTIAHTLGNAIGKPELKWVTFKDEQSLQGAIQAGLPAEIAKNYTEMGHAIMTGIMTEDYWKNKPDSLGTIKLEDFAVEFAAAYNAGH
jgi:uncharacterized protein YbjT (DUF2867 family)